MKSICRFLQSSESLKISIWLILFLWRKQTNNPLNRNSLRGKRFTLAHITRGDAVHQGGKAWGSTVVITWSVGRVGCWCSSPFFQAGIPSCGMVLSTFREGLSSSAKRLWGCLTDMTEVWLLVDSKSSQDDSEDWLSQSRCFLNVFRFNRLARL